MFLSSLVFPTTRHLEHLTYWQKGNKNIFVFEHKTKQIKNKKFKRYP